MGWRRLWPQEALPGACSKPIALQSKYLAEKAVGQSLQRDHRIRQQMSCRKSCWAVLSRADHLTHDIYYCLSMAASSMLLTFSEAIHAFQ